MSLDDQKAYLKRHPKSKHHITAKPYQSLEQSFVDLHNAAAKEYKQAFKDVGARMWHDDESHPIKQYSIPEIAEISRPLTVLDSYPNVTTKQRKQLNQKVDEIHDKYSNLWKKIKKEHT
jgi:DNA-binding ferritin-like protein (Dps family)